MYVIDQTQIYTEYKAAFHNLLPIKIIILIINGYPGWFSWLFRPTCLRGHLVGELLHRVKKIVFPMRLITNMKISVFLVEPIAICIVIASGLDHFKWELKQIYVKQEIEKC